MINQTPNSLSIFNGMKPTLILRLLISDNNVSKRLANNTRMFSSALYLLHSPPSKRPQQAKTSRSASLTSNITIIFPYRKQVGVATLGGFLYAIGGCDHGHRYDSVERYDPGKDQWVVVAPMSTPRSGCGVGVLDGFIYVVGGYDGTSYLSSVER